MKRSDIIPVTHEIRNYLKSQLPEKEKNKILNKLGLNPEDYDVIKEIGKIIITNIEEDYQEKMETIDNKIFFLKDLAEKMDKSLVWVYQEMVLNGYGKYIDRNSDIYKASLLAYEDVELILNILPQDEERWYEDFCILNGDLYEQELNYKEIFSKRRKR